MKKTSIRELTFLSPDESHLLSAFIEEWNDTLLKSIDSNCTDLSVLLSNKFMQKYISKNDLDFLTGLIRISAAHIPFSP